MHDFKRLCKNIILLNYTYNNLLIHLLSMFSKTIKNGCLKLRGRYFIWIRLKQFICIQQTQKPLSAFNWNIIELLLVNSYYRFYGLW